MQYSAKLMDKPIDSIRLNSANASDLGPDPVIHGMQRVTKWLIRSQRIECSLGYVLLTEWLENEVERISSAPGRVAKVVTFKGCVALYVN